MKLGATILSNVIVLGCIAVTEAKPFINPFNVAIKTEFGDQGNTISFVYPKNSYKVNVNYKKESLNGHEFNIGQFFGHVARSIGRNLSFLNPFALSSGSGNSKTKTTTEHTLDFGPDDRDSIISVSGSTTEETVLATDGDVSGNGHETDEVEISISSSSEEYDTNKYLPPNTTPTANYLPPITVYLPPKNNIKRQ